MKRANVALLLSLLLSPTAPAAWPEPRALDEDRLLAAGLRVIRSEHATLVTDVASSAEIDALPELIDLALPQWGERFDVRPSQLADWQLRVYLVGDESKFRSLELWPDLSSEFQHGLSLGYEVWVREQATDYYRRHLLLHEATHSFMSTLLGGCGPGWFMEGVAELCGTHSWDPSRRELRLAVIPQSREAAPDWGRVRLVRDAVAEGRLLSIDAVLKTDNRRVLPAESYAWVWALATLLDRHPAYQEHFRQLPRLVTRDDFNRQFARAYERDRERLDAEWRHFATTLAYGHDVDREAITFEEGRSLAVSGSRRVAVLANRGWQSTGVAVEAGRTYKLKATGRFVINRDPDGMPWPCEANGVTLAYHAGRPVGQLLATVDRGPGAFIESTVVGLAADYEPPTSGTLYLRVNDAPNSLADNEGELSVTIR